MRLVLQIEAEVRETTFPEIVEAMDTRKGVILTIPTIAGGEVTIEGQLTGAREPAGA
jgi:hypothetical protein